jgi:hypothetical protein
MISRHTAHQDGCLVVEVGVELHVTEPGLGIVQR